MSGELGGVYIAKVKEAKLDNEGCIAVEIESRQLNLRARLASFGAGDGRGVFMVPEQGDQVVVAFVGGESQEAVVIGSLWSMQAKPPVTATDDKNAVKAIKTKGGHSIRFGEEDKQGAIEIRTVGGHTLVLSDEDKNGAVKIATAGGHSLVLSDEDQKGRLEILTTGGHRLLLSDEAGEEKVEVWDSGGTLVVRLDTANGVIEIDAADGLLTLTATEVTIDGQLNVTGESTFDDRVTIGTGPKKTVIDKNTITG